MALVQDEAERTDLDMERPAPFYGEEDLRYESFVNAGISTANVWLTLGLAVAESLEVEQSESSESETTYWPFKNKEQWQLALWALFQPQYRDLSRKEPSSLSLRFGRSQSPVLNPGGNFNVSYIVSRKRGGNGIAKYFIVWRKIHHGTQLKYASGKEIVWTFSKNWWRISRFKRNI